MDKFESLSHTMWDCKYHIVFIPKGRRKVLYGQLLMAISPNARGIPFRLRSSVYLTLSGEVLHTAGASCALGIAALRSET